MSAHTYGLTNYTEGGFGADGAHGAEGTLGADGFGGILPLAACSVSSDRSVPQYGQIGGYKLPIGLMEPPHSRHSTGMATEAGLKHISTSFQ